jgi:predicted nucleotidyltransferase
MNVARPYEIFSHRLDTEALVALARTTRPLPARQIWRLAGSGSERGVRLALQRLVTHGVVDSQAAGRAELYTLNRQHLAAPIAEQIAGLRGAMFDRLRATIGAWETQPFHASVFGSAARGDGDTDSDIDLLVVRPAGTDEEDERWRGQLEELVEALRRWTGNEVSLAELSAEDAGRLRTGRAAITKELRSDAVDLAGVPARRLVRGR